MKHVTDVEALTLGNIHPTINDQWTDAIKRIVHDFQDESERHEKGTRGAEIVLKVKFKHNLENRSTSIEATLTPKLPGYRGVAQVVRLPRGGERLLVEVDDFEQMDLYTHDNPDDKEVQ